MAQNQTCIENGLGQDKTDHVLKQRPRLNGQTLNNFLFQGNRTRDSKNAGLGMGIRANNSSLTIKNLYSGGYSCVFSNGNAIGINSTGSQVIDIEDAHFTFNTRLDINIDASTNANYNVKIKNNRFDVITPTVGSVNVQRAAFGGPFPFNYPSFFPLIRTEISNNIFTLVNQNTQFLNLTNAIYFINTSNVPGASDRAEIANNQITSSYGNGQNGTPVAINGIVLAGSQNVSGYRVTGNIIDFTNPTTGQVNQPANTSLGFAINPIMLGQGLNEIGPNNNIRSTIFNTNNSLRGSWIRCGIHVVTSPGLFVCSNDISGASNNYHFDTSNNGNIEFGRNKIGSAFKGLAIDGNIPRQLPYRMNQWIPGSVFRDHSAHDSNPPAPGPNAPPFNWLVDGSNNNALGYLPPNNFISPVDNLPEMSPAWITSTPNNYQSLTFCDLMPLFFPFTNNPPTGEMANNFLNNYYNFPSSAISWDFERWLLGQMILNPTSFAGNTVAENYYASKLNSSLWQLANGEQMLSYALSGPTFNSTLNQLCADNILRMDSICKLEILEGADTSTFNSIWQSTKSDLLTQCFNASTSINVISNTIRSQQLAALSTVKSFVNNIQTNNFLESNYKTILLLKLKLNAEEPWTNDDSTAIRGIAYSCPSIGGEGVLIARKMLPMTESATFVQEGDDPYCVTSRSEKYPLKDGEINIWPNPTNSNLNVVFNKPFSGDVQIVNASGVVVFSNQISESIETSISTTSIPNGIYVVRLIQSGTTISVKKVAIFH